MLNINWGSLFSQKSSKPEEDSKTSKSKELVKGIGLGAARSVATIVSLSPYISQLGPILHSLLDAIEQAQYNKSIAEVLGKRVEELCNTLKHLEEAKARELDGEIQNVRQLLDECKEFISSFCVKGFMNRAKKYLRTQEDKTNLAALDQRLSSCIQNLNLRLGISHFKLTEQSQEKLGEISNLLKRIEAANNDPSILARITMQAGCLNPEEIKHELSNLGLNMDQIQQGISSISGELRILQKKLDETNKTLHAMTVQSQKEAEERKSQYTESMRAHRRMEDAIASIQKATGASIPIVYSDEKEVERLYAMLSINSAPDHLLVHHYGIGSFLGYSDSSIKGKDGEVGYSGRNGRSGRHGNDGQGHEAGEDGSDGEDGDDGFNGSLGGMGANMGSCHSLITLLSIDGSGSRNYHISHRDPNGAMHEENFTWKPNTSPSLHLALIWKLGGGKGGIGGNGGPGGCGGTGGNGGYGQIESGHGGKGGNGGSGGKGANGGDGGNGGQVIIYTSDPAVLMLTQIDVLGGEGGGMGLPGESGPGGQGGFAGGKKYGAVTAPGVLMPARSLSRISSMSIGPFTSGDTASQTVVLQVRSGKDGKDGKPGKSTRNDPHTKAGSRGKPGRVSFCILNNDGRLIESGGYPYHLGFSKQQTEQLRLTSCTYDVPNYEEQISVFGHQLQLSPCSPVNSGDLCSPDCELNCDIVIPGMPVHSSQVKFGSVPARKGAIDGAIVGGAKLCKIAVPSWKVVHGHIASLGLTFRELSTLGLTGTMRVYFTVFGVPFVFDGSCTVEVVIPVCFSLPFEISSATLSSPSLVVGEPNGIFQIKIRNLMTATTLKRMKADHPNCCKYIIHIRGQGLRPLVENMNSEELPAQVVSSADSQVSQARFNQELHGFVPEIEPMQEETLQFSVKIDQGQRASGPGVPGRPGSFCHLQCSLVYDGIPALHSESLKIRVAPKLPGPGNKKWSDMLFICGEHWQETDYTLISKLCTLGGLSAHFLDWDHYFDSNTNCLPQHSWESFFGKATVVFDPPPASKLAALPKFCEALIRHYKSGGGLVVTSSSGISREVVGIRERFGGRIEIRENLYIHGLKSGEEEVTSRAIHGPRLAELLKALINTIPLAAKLDVIASGGGQNAQLQLVAFGNLGVFEEVVDKGCCCNISINYERKAETPAVFLDLLLACLLDEVLDEMAEYATHGDSKRCPAITGLSAIPNKPLAAALFDASNIYRRKKGPNSGVSMSKNQKAWRRWRSDLKAQAKCIGNEEERRQGRELGQRILEMRSLKPTGPKAFANVGREPSATLTFVRA